MAWIPCRLHGKVKEILRAGRIAWGSCS